MDLLHSFNPLWAQLRHFYKLRGKFRVVQGFANKLRVFTNGPAWAPGSSRLGKRHYIPKVRNLFIFILHLIINDLSTGYRRSHSISESGTNVGESILCGALCSSAVYEPSSDWRSKWIQCYKLHCKICEKLKISSQNFDLHSPVCIFVICPNSTLHKH